MSDGAKVKADLGDLAIGLRKCGLVGNSKVANRALARIEELENERDDLRGSLEEWQADFKALQAELAALKDGAIEVVQKHRRHILKSPGVPTDTRTYALRTLDDVEADLRALSKNGEGSDG